ncbi:MAG: NAD(P)H-dependent oxidoreductase [Rhodobacteraceae bacterium]|nr:NAD(P)H-dependent oxidoreductase [Paracoccaceae bacterium]
MRVLLVYCHPEPASFTAAIRDLVCARLDRAGAEFRQLDLYQESFDPVLSRGALAAYSDPSKNRATVEAHVANIEWSDSLIFIYPTWWYGMPAMLKGWLDRVFLPGSAFHLPGPGEQAIRPGLRHINRIAVFTTCGASWLWTQIIGSPGKRILLRGLRSICARHSRTEFAAHYSMDSSTPESRARHLEKVSRAMDRFLSAEMKRR